MSEITSKPRDGEDDGVAIVPFTSSHLVAASGLSRELSWPYRLEDWAFAARLGRGLALEKAGALIGTALWWTYGDDFASAGMIIVAKSEQGRGRGAALFDALLAEVGSRSVVLNATREGLPLYRRREFHPIGTLHQHQGILSARAGSASPPDLRRGRPGDVAAIVELDRRASGLPRHAVLDRMIAAGEVVVIERGDQLAGFAISRAFGRGRMVGPVVAETSDDAYRLIEALLHDLDGTFVRLDVPVELGFGPWLEARGIVRVDEATTMVRGPRPPTDGRVRTYAIAQQCFG